MISDVKQVLFGESNSPRTGEMNERADSDDNERYYTSNTQWDVAASMLPD
jgi:hypothetical protein